jgi:predicted regulator of Ras-like GTPase activity (Roadblock/LC7/MglB family)
MQGAIGSLLERNPEITGAAFVLEDGTIESSAFPDGVEEWRFGAVTGSILDICAEAAAELNEEGPTEIVIAGAAGFVALVWAQPGCHLVCTASIDARVADVLLDMKRAIGGRNSLPDDRVSV